MTVEFCPLLSALPWLKHGFFGGDNPCATSKNLVGNHAFSKEFPAAVFLKQTHSANVLQEPFDLSVEADAIVTAQTEIALAIKTADCCPVLLACTHTRRIAAIHAGWRGALNGVVLKTIGLMVDQGADPDAIIAAIGPSIHPSSYPVQDDVRERFAGMMPEALTCFVPFQDRWRLDVAGIVQMQLAKSGIRKIWQSDVDTFSNPAYASYRRHTADSSAPETRNISIISRVLAC